MTDKATIAVWGCTLCSNVWAASADGSSPVPYALSAVWLAFAGLIVWVERLAA